MAAPMESVISVSPNSFPIKTKQTAVEIAGERTELVCTQYQDRTFLIVTQYNKIGTLVNITRDNIIDEGGSCAPVYSTKVLLGRDEPMTHVVAKNLIGNLSSQKPILLSMALKDTSIQTVRALSNLLPSLL